MKPSTDLVMQALGDEDGFKVVATLIKDGPQTQSSIASNASVSVQRTGETLRLLRFLGLVEREPSTRGKWSVTSRDGIAAVFTSAAKLATEIAQARSVANAADHASWLAIAEDRGSGGPT